MQTVTSWRDRQAQQQAEATVFQPEQLRWRLRSTSLTLVVWAALAVWRAVTALTSGHLGGVRTNDVLLALALVVAGGAVLQLSIMLRARRLWLADPRNAGMTARPGSLPPLRVS